MIRISIVAAVILLGIAAVWHPAPRPALAVVAPAASAARTPRAHKAPLTTAAVVYVAGAVARPGLYRIASGGRVADAVRLAGGLRSDADPVAVNLAARVNDGDEVAVARLGETLRAPARRRPSRSTKTPPSIVDLNAADARTLATIPGIGATIAARIVAVRGNDGRYDSFDELLDVAGMTQARLDRARPYLTI